MSLQLQRTLPELEQRSEPRHEHSPAFAAACARVARSRRPIFFVGRGTIHHAPLLRQLIERVNAPVITTPSARGVISEDHPLNLGFRPFAGRLAEVNKLLDSADVILAIGCKLSHSDTDAFELRLPADRLIHFDAGPEVIEANYPTSIGVVADSGTVLRELLRSCTGQSDWTATELEDWRRRLGPQGSDTVEPTIAGTPARTADGFFKALRSVLPDNAILVLDSGLHQVLARRYYRAHAPHGLLMPTDLQSMGFAIPTAIGARLALPHRPVVALLGDGGFAMTGLELLSAVRENISLVVIIFVDGAFGQIRLQQLANYGMSHGVMLNNPDFRLLASSLGLRYESVGSEDDIGEVMRSAINDPGITVAAVSVNDAFQMRRVAATAIARGVARRTAGPRILGFLRRLFRRS
jgi:acetolactate synthase I/II/III large subunit